MVDGLLSLSWNNHVSTFCHMLSLLRNKEKFTDVTITCDGNFYAVHKFVLSACSDYFLKMFERTPCKHPIIVLKDIQSKDIEALLSYMYNGVVSVAQTDLSQLIKAAELLQIKGLAVPDEPPSPSKKNLNTRSSTDHTSPHPKRQRRDQNSHSQSDMQSNMLQAPSDSQDGSQRISEKGPEKDNRKEKETDFRRSQRQINDNAFADQEKNSHRNEGVQQPLVPKNSPPPNEEILVDETVIKEEILDASNEGSFSETGIDYSSLDLVADSGGSIEDQTNLDLVSSFDQPEGHSYDSQAGPSGLQGWSVMNEPGEVLTQDYCQETNQDIPLASLPSTLSQETQPMVPMNKEVERQGEDGASIPGKTGGIPRHRHDKSRLQKTLQGPFSCNFCDLTFSKAVDRRKHKIVHAEERPFKCTLCPAQFHQNIHLKDHMHIHTGEKPYSCPLCPYRCANNSSIHRHVKTHTEKKPYSCQLCLARFEHKRSARRHICFSTNE